MLGNPGVKPHAVMYGAPARLRLGNINVRTPGFTSLLIVHEPLSKAALVASTDACMKRRGGGRAARRHVLLHDTGTFLPPSAEQRTLDRTEPADSLSHPAHRYHSASRLSCISWRKPTQINSLSTLHGQVALVTIE